MSEDNSPHPADFFVPLPSFWEFVPAGRIVIDIGCGYSTLVRELGQRGFMAAGIELQAEKVYGGGHAPPSVLVGNAIGNVLLTSESPTPRVGLFCRPCHGDWIFDTIEAAHRDIEWRYVGFHKNLGSDLDGLCWEQLSDAPVGADGEYIFKVTRASYAKGSERYHNWLHVWVLLETNCGRHWMRSRWDDVGKVGQEIDARIDRQRNTLRGKAIRFGFAEADYDLDPTFTSTWQTYHTMQSDTSIKTGFISPEGTMYRCKYSGHIQFADEYLRKSARDLVDKEGWCQVGLDISDNEPRALCWFDDKARLTWQQAQTLISEGIAIPDFMFEAAEKPPAGASFKGDPKICGINWWDFRGSGDEPDLFIEGLDDRYEAWEESKT